MKILPPKLYTPPSILQKVELKTISHNDGRRIFKPYGIDNQLFGRLDISFEQCVDDLNNWIIKIKNSLGKLMGFEIVKMAPQEDVIKGLTMEVPPEYRHKGFRFGELLRLFSIIEMNENKNSCLNLYSRPGAIYFHSKYKFEPNNFYLPERDMMLMTISKDEGFPELAERAKSLQERIMTQYSDTDAQQIFCQEANLLAKEYISKALAQDRELAYLEHPFEQGFSMTLTRENLLKNKDFFNQCFKKYGIDYKV